MDCLSSFPSGCEWWISRKSRCLVTLPRYLLLLFIVPAISRGSSERNLSQETFRALDEKKKKKEKKCNAIHRIPSRIWVSRTKRDRPTEGDVKKKKSREKRNVTPNIATDVKSLICPVAFFFFYR